jgi:hypothetical protein
MKIAEISSDGRTFSEAAIDFLAKAPADEVFTLIELTAALKRQIPTSRQYQKLEPYSVQGRVNGRKQWLFGSPAALKVLRKKLQTL